MRYLHVCIYVKISASYVERCTLQSDDRQTNTQTNIQSKNWGNLFLSSIFFFIFYFRLKRWFPIKWILLPSCCRTQTRQLTTKPRPFSPAALGRISTYIKTRKKPRLSIGPLSPNRHASVTRVVLPVWHVQTCSLRTEPSILRIKSKLLITSVWFFQGFIFIQCYW